jgi:YidC/Oxa1 family membrane protein insertase
MLQGDQKDQNRNMMIAVGLSLAVIFLFDIFIAGPARERAEAERAVQEQIEATQTPETAPEPALRPAETILAESAAGRVAIDTPSLDGTLNLTGARFDDLNLRRYRETLDEGAPEVNLLSPRGSTHSLDAVFGWEDRDPSFNGVGAEQVWTAPAGAILSPTQPLVLTHVSGDGLTITRTITVDENYMITMADEVRNDGEAARELRPYATVRRQNLPEDFTPNQIVHQGFTGVFGGENPTLHEVRFQAADRHARDRLRGRVGDDERIEAASGTGGWLGITDHYWLAAMIPAQNEPVQVHFDARDQGEFTDYRAAYTGAYRAIAPGESVTYTQRFFTGAKRVEVLRGYGSGEGGGEPVPDLDKAVDWGMFWFLTRPFFALLSWFYGFVGNFGVAILLATVVVKAIMFPLVYTSYKSMAKLRAVAPKIKEIQERFAADKQRQMQEMQRLYQTEKLNPVAGCIPILLQIPIFYALYKVLTVTIETRHAPFFGWIKDLSAPDPAYITNLFGLIPYDPAGIPILSAVLAIGVFPILYGISMWLLQSLSPPPPDKMQQQIFALLPILFTFLFAGFAAGLVIYWTWSNTLSIAQQYFIMRSQGVETEFDKWLAKRFGKKVAA